MNEEGVRYQGRERGNEVVTVRRNQTWMTFFLKCVRIKTERRALMHFTAAKKYCCTLLQKIKQITSPMVDYYCRKKFYEWKKNVASIVRHHSRLNARHVA